MDETKLRIIAGAGAVFFGFAGITAFSVAGVIALQAVIGLTWAVISVACAMMALCLASVVVFLRPNKSAEEELDQFEDATADLLADLPFDTIASIVERRPMAAAPCPGHRRWRCEYHRCSSSPSNMAPSKT